jgi:hypothetical protein
MVRMTWPRREAPFRFDHPPQLVCLDCGKAVFGRIVRPFDLIESQECDICAAPGEVVHASAFRDFDRMSKA